MNRDQLVLKVAKHANIPEDQALKVVVSLAGAIIESMESGYDVSLENFATLRLKEKVTKIRGRELTFSARLSKALRKRLRNS